MARLYAVGAGHALRGDTPAGDEEVVVLVTGFGVSILDVSDLYRLCCGFSNFIMIIYALSFSSSASPLFNIISRQRT